MGADDDESARIRRAGGAHPAHNLLRTLRSDLEATRASRRHAFGVLAISVGRRLFDEDELPWSSPSIRLPIAFGEPAPASEMHMVIDHDDATRFATVAMFGDPSAAREMRDHAAHLGRAAEAAFSSLGMPTSGLAARHGAAAWPLTLVRLAAVAPDAFRYTVACSILPDDRADLRRATESFREMIPTGEGRLRSGPPRWDRIASAIRGEWAPPPGIYAFAIDRDLYEASVEAVDYLMTLEPAEGSTIETVVEAPTPAEAPAIDMDALANELVRSGQGGASNVVRLFVGRDSVPSYEVAAACCKKGEGASPAAIKSALYRARQAIRGLGGDWSRIDFRTAGEWVVKVVEPR